MSKVSIIIPCYKQAHFLPETLDSVLAQTHADWECIIVNDGSPDNTREVTAEYCKMDSRFRYVEQENRGLSGARNCGLDVASGQWIQFLDSDDYLLPEKIKAQLDLIGYGEKIALAYCHYYFSAAGDLLKKVDIDYALEHPVLDSRNAILDIAKRWETELSIPVHCFLFDARIFRDHGIRFDQTLSNHEDWDCWMRILKLLPQIYLVEKELVAYRKHENSMCSSGNAMWLGYSAAIRKQLELNSDNSGLKRILQRKYKTTRERYLGKPDRLVDILHKQLALAWKTVSRIYRANMPWPMQRWLNKVFTRSAR